MLNVQEPFGAIVAPERLTVPDPAVAVITLAGASVLPPRLPVAGSVTPGGRALQPPVRPFGEAIIKPAGSTSLNPIALRMDNEFVLRMVKLSVVVPSNGMLAAPNAWLMLGGWIALTFKTALAVGPVPPSLDEIKEVLFTFVPNVIPCTVILNVQEPFAASAAPKRLTVPDPATAIIVGAAGP
jgi:hypothetical protein